MVEKASRSAAGASSRSGLWIDSEEYAARRHERHRWIELYHDYYAGDPYSDEARWRTLMGYSEELEVPRTRVNFARMVVERAMSWTFSGFNGLDIDGDTRESELLREFFRSELEPVLEELFVELAVSGDALLLLRERSGGGLPKLELVPALEFDAEPGRDLVRVSYRFVSDGRPHLHREEHEPGASRFYRPEPVPRRGFLGLLSNSSGPELSRSREWPEGFTPFVHLRNRPRRGQLYGTSDLVRLIDDYNLKLAQRSDYLSRALTPLLKNVNGRRVDGGGAGEEMLTVTGEEVELDYLSPGGDREAAQLHLEGLRRMISELSGVSLLDPGELTSVGALSGFALQLLMQPLIRLTERKRKLVFQRGVAQVLQKVALLLRHSGETEPGPEQHMPRINFEFDPLFEEMPHE